MRNITVKALRDGQNTKLRGLVTVLAVAFWVGTYGGWYMSAESFKHSFEKVCRELHLADLQVFLDPFTDEEYEALENLPGLRVKHKRLILRGSVETKSGETLQVCVVYDNEFESLPINNLKLLAGEMLQKTADRAHASKVLIDRTMASAHGFKIGDNLVLTIHGTAKEVEVQGIVLSPEFLFPSADPTLELPAKGSLGVIFSNMADIVSFFGSPIYNNLSFLFETTTNHQELKEAVRAQLSNRGIQALFTKEDSFDQKIMNGVFQASNQFAPIALNSMLMVVLIILSINFSRLIEERRQDLAILQAIGTSKKTIIFYILKLTTPSLIVGLLAGFILSFGLQRIFASNLTKQLDLPQLCYVYVPLLPLKAIVCISPLVLLVLVASALRILRLNPSIAMRGTVPEIKSLPKWATPSSTRSTTGNPEFLWFKYTFRSLLRDWRLATLTIISVSFALALTVSFNILASSINGTLRHFCYSNEWNLIVDFKVPLDMQELQNALPNRIIEQYEGYSKGWATLETPTRNSMVQVVGLSYKSNLRKLRPVAGSTFSSDTAREVILNKNLWKEESPYLGQEIFLEVGGQRHKMTLAGMVDEPTIAVNHAYVPIGTAQLLLNQQMIFS